MLFNMISLKLLLIRSIIPSSFHWFITQPYCCPSISDLMTSYVTEKSPKDKAFALSGRL